MAKYNYSLELHDIVDYSDAPIADGNYEGIKEELEFFGEVLVAEQREDGTYFNGTLNELGFIGVVREYFEDGVKGDYLYDWTISNWPMNNEADDEERNRMVWEGVGYHLKLCNAIESSNGSESYHPLHKESSGIIKRMLESMGEVQIAEQREEYTYFEGIFDDLMSMEILDVVFDLYKVDLTLTNHRY
jgi:hypothetical protein